MLYVMITVCLLLAGGLFFCGLYFPFWKHKTPLLPVLCFGKVGKTPKGSALYKEWISPQKLAQKLDWVLKLGFTPVTPEDLLAFKEGVSLPPKPVILVFKYGLESFYKDVFPLLQEREIKACVCLCEEHIGQYNAWQNPQREPWQNTLNESELAELKKSKRVSFVSHGLSYTNLNELDAQKALWHAGESKTRLEKLNKLSINAFFYPTAAPSKELEDELHPVYGVTFSPKTGVNKLSSPLSMPLNTLPAWKMGLWRLRAKMTRG